MIWTIIIINAAIILAFIMFRFYRDLNKDKKELQKQSLPEKFKIIFDTLNDAAFFGQGKVYPNKHDKRRFSLYEDGKNQIINFDYSTGILNIEWRFKYLHNEVIYSKAFGSVRDISYEQQQNIAEIMISHMEDVVKKHIEKVEGGII